MVQGIAQTVFDFALIAGAFHVDEVDNDQTAQVAKTQLTGDFVGGFQVGLEGGFFDVATLGSATRVDVNRDQRFGMVDHDGAARRQVHLTRISRFDLMFNLEAREKRYVVMVTLHTIDVVRHHLAHEGLCLLEDVVGIDEDFADIRLEVIADGADDEAAFLENEQRCGVVFGDRVNGGPQLHQVIQIPLQFFGGAADGSGAGDQAHAIRHGELGHGIAQFRTVIAFDAARDAAAARVVRHQHQISTCQGNVSGEGGSLVATLVFVDLNDQFLTFFQGFLHFGAATFAVRGVELASDFLERQEAMTFGAIVDKDGFERRLDTGDDTLVDIAFALFFSSGFDVEVDQFLTFNDGDAQFLCLRRIE